MYYIPTQSIGFPLDFSSAKKGKRYFSNRCLAWIWKPCVSKKCWDLEFRHFCCCYSSSPRVCEWLKQINAKVSEFLWHNNNTRVCSKEILEIPPPQNAQWCFSNNLMTFRETHLPPPPTTWLCKCQFKKLNKRSLNLERCTKYCWWCLDGANF